jgi:hypothetical protein
MRGEQDSEVSHDVSCYPFGAKAAMRERTEEPPRGITRRTPTSRRLFNFACRRSTYAYDPMVMRRGIPIMGIPLSVSPAPFLSAEDMQRIRLRNYITHYNLLRALHHSTDLFLQPLPQQYNSCYSLPGFPSQQHHRLRLHLPMSARVRPADSQVRRRWRDPYNPCRC